MNNFSCSTIQNAIETIFLTPFNTKITLDITDKLKESESNRDEMSFVIHLDTTPIECNFTAIQIQNIYRSTMMLLSHLARPSSQNTSPIVEAAPPMTTFDFQINEFIGETTNSEISSEDVVLETGKYTLTK